MDDKRLILFGPKVHALYNGLFRTKDANETAALYDEVATLFVEADVADEAGLQNVATMLINSAAERFGFAGGTRPHTALAHFVTRIIDYEGWWLLPDIDWNQKRETSAWWELRDQLHRQRNLVLDMNETLHLIDAGIIHILAPLANCLGAVDPTPDEHALTVQTSLLHRVSDLPAVLDTVLQNAHAEDLVDAGLFTRLRDQIERNLIVASGGNLLDPRTYQKATVLPSRSAQKDPHTLTDTYLHAMPLLEFATQETVFTIPTRTRFEHMHIVAGSGHGKSQTLQYLIANDLEAVAAGKRSVVVIDSQGDPIENIRQLKVFAPGEPLHDRVVVIDPTDVEFPVSLNLFDVGMDRLAGYDPLERERLTNSILELYDFVLGSLLDAGMTQKQSVIFRYVTRLMLHIEDATIHTLVELMEDDSHEVFKDDIAKLSGTAKRFFDTEFAGKEFTQTRKQVLRRLWGILENQTFERMFSHPRSKLDLYSEMNAGKIILINTAKDLLKEQGTQIFGRFFIALIAQAAQERATLPASKRLPTFVYVDEAADYFDHNIGVILSQARKYNVGMVLAHQYLGQLDGKLQEAFGANTSIKLAGGVSTKDARALAPMLYCDPSLIERQPKGGFAAFVRGVSATALPLSFPFGHMEHKPRMSREEWLQLRDQMRERYAVPIAALGQSPEPEPPDTEGPPADDPPNEVSIDPGSEW